MIALGVVVIGALLGEEEQIPITEDDHPVRALGHNRQRETLGVRVQIGAPRRQSNRSYARLLKQLAQLLCIRRLPNKHHAAHGPPSRHGPRGAGRPLTGRRAFPRLALPRSCPDEITPPGTLKTRSERSLPERSLRTRAARFALAARSPARRRLDRQVWPPDPAFGVRNSSRATRSLSAGSSGGRF